MTPTPTRELERTIARARSHEERAPVIRGADLREAREAARIRAASIARFLNVSRQYIARVERRDSVTIATAEEYAEAVKAVSRGE